MALTSLDLNIFKNCFRIWIQHKIYKRFFEIFFLQYKIVNSQPFGRILFFFYYNIFINLKRSDLRWADSWFLKKVTNQLPLMSSIHLQDRKTSNHQSDKDIHVIIGNRAWPSLNEGSLEIIIVYLTSLKNRNVWDTS